MTPYLNNQKCENSTVKIRINSQVKVSGNLTECTSRLSSLSNTIQHTHTILTCVCIHMYIYTHTYICIYMCVCVCVYIYREREREREGGGGNNFLIKYSQYGGDNKK